MSKKIIGLDAGHGLKTAGKQTPDGIKEWTLNDKVRDFVVDFLKDYDVECIFTDNNEGNTDESLTARRTMYVNQKVDAFVSIHHNAYLGTWGNATGVEVYTDKNPTLKDTELAKAIYKNLPNYTGLKGRGIKSASFTVINQNSIPAVLVEGGFMDSNIDYKVITSTDGQKAYAKAVAEGLIEFLKLSKKEVPAPVVKPTTTTSASRNYLMKGDKGAEVKTMQENLIYVGYSCGKAGVDGDFGQGTDSALRSFQKANGLTVDGKYGTNSKAKLEALVAKKKQEAAKPAPTPTPAPTYTKQQCVKDIQSALGGLTVDGICGAKTLAKLPTISKSINNRHKIVKYVQKYLNANSFAAGTEDGIAGAKFDSAVKAFQKAKGLTADGIIGNNTWKKMFG